MLNFQVNMMSTQVDGIHQCWCRFHKRCRSDLLYE